MLASSPLRRYYPLFSILVLLAGAGWIWVSRTSPATTTQGRIPAPRRGFLAPDFSLPTLSGETVTLSSLRGRPVLVNLWASWCQPCRAEMPAIQRVYAEYQDQGFVVLAVNATNQDSLNAVQPFIEELGLTFPILIDADGVVSNLYELRALPTSYFVDGNGVIQDMVIGGPMSEALLRVRVQQLMQASGEGGK